MYKKSGGRTLWITVIFSARDLLMIGINAISHHLSSSIAIIVIENLKNLPAYRFNQACKYVTLSSTNSLTI